ncbi:hypothetical protein A3J15_02355 [Candidatus Roizmanbacteria bacterium RIFCSPLOWO2_02_FULL_38_10]|uniref:5'-3' exonuclease domain-containing protein n=1 Tax=Candidatus Roizmanbacteria bacterium RIFCSPLOWO2_02_FULL_38_10 TaxID=1802074 RepID=A0A1F7JME3_9BACT|nr:MAG: hypothetical protein A3J15_02355 [Candidatus Roizmanbacteria bacterium RIFCSPLOWO2_02_FULL_38_10]
MNTFLLIDGNALIHRAFHALPAFKTSTGIQTNAAYGFATMIHKAITDLKPTHVIVCFDSKEPTFRDKLFKQYRTQRPEVKPELIDQFPLVKEFLVSAGIKMIEKPGLEADDLIGILATRIEKTGQKNLILSGDKDLMQLVTKKTNMMTPQLGFGKAQLFDEQTVKKKLGVDPSQVPLFKALAGDPSDNYKGVTGIGPKTAVLLIQEFKTLDNIYKQIDLIKSPKLKQALIDYKDNAYLSQKLATILRTDGVTFDLDTASFTGYNEVLRNYFMKLEMPSLVNRFFSRIAKPKRGEPKKPEQFNLF